MPGPSILPATLGLAALLAGPLLGAPARAAELKVLTAGAFRPVVAALAPAFARETGDTLAIDNDTAGALARRIAGGEAFDLAILPPETLAGLAATGRVPAAGGRALACTGVGIVVAAGTPRPDIATVPALRRSLLAARSIAYIDPAAGGSSGAAVVRLLRRLGIADQVRSRTVLVEGGRVAEHVVAGEAQLGIHQISEIVPVKGAVLVGPLPEAVQSTTCYAAAPAAGTRLAAGAGALVRLLSGPEGAAALRGRGLQPAP